MASRPSPRLGLNQAARIKQGRDFRRIRESGRRITKGCLVLNWLAVPERSRPRLGVITAGKLGNAVTRNRARRMIREAFRLHQHELAAAADLVIVARASIRTTSFAELERDYLDCLGRAKLLNPAAPGS